MIHWGFATACFVWATVALVPWLALVSRRKIVTGAVALPPRRRLFIQTIVLQTIIGGLALAAAHQNGITLFPPFRLDAVGVAAAAVWLAVVLGTLPLRWKVRSVGHKRRLVALLPTTMAERVWWTALCLSAGVWEEIAYRGTLFGLASRLTESWWVAVLACCAVFGLSHLVQGWKSAALIVVVAFGFHVVVRVTGGLYVAMGIHFLYDVVAGIWLGATARDLEAPAVPEGQPA